MGNWQMIECEGCKYNNDHNSYFGVGSCGRKCYELAINLKTFEYKKKQDGRVVENCQWISVCAKWAPIK